MRNAKRQRGRRTEMQGDVFGTVKHAVSSNEVDPVLSQEKACKVYKMKVEWVKCHVRVCGILCTIAGHLP